MRGPYSSLLVSAIFLFSFAILPSWNQPIRHSSTFHTNRIIDTISEFKFAYLYSLGSCLSPNRPGEANPLSAQEERTHRASRIHRESRRYNATDDDINARDSAANACPSFTHGKATSSNAPKALPNIRKYAPSDSSKASKQRLNRRAVQGDVNPNSLPTANDQMFIARSRAWRTCYERGLALWQALRDATTRIQPLQCPTISPSWDLRSFSSQSFTWAASCAPDGIFTQLDNTYNVGPLPSGVERICSDNYFSYLQSSQEGLPEAAINYFWYQGGYSALSRTIVTTMRRNAINANDIQTRNRASRGPINNPDELLNNIMDSPSGSSSDGFSDSSSSGSSSSDSSSSGSAAEQQSSSPDEWYKAPNDWADMAFASWSEVCKEQGRPLSVMKFNMNIDFDDAATLVIADELFELTEGSRRARAYGKEKLSFGLADSHFYALLGTPIGADEAALLIKFADAFATRDDSNNQNRITQVKTIANIAMVYNFRRAGYTNSVHFVLEDADLPPGFVDESNSPAPPGGTFSRS